jgi:hypothetical protein
LANRRRNLPTYRGEAYDAREEIDFAMWLEEAATVDLVQGWAHHPAPIHLADPAYFDVPVQLKTKVKMSTRTLLQEHVYTADFAVTFTPRIRMVDAPFRFPAGMWILVEIKARYSRFNMDRTFSLNQKWVWQRHGIWVQKIEPLKLFGRTWCPAGVRVTPKQGKPRKGYETFLTLENYRRRHDGRELPLREE